MARKTSKDYRKEYKDKLSKLQGLEARIKVRALELCKQYPAVPVDMEFLDLRKPNVLTPMKYGRTAGEFGALVAVGDLNPNSERLLDVIGYIEEYNRVNFPHVQTKIKYD